MKTFYYFPNFKNKPELLSLIEQLDPTKLWRWRLDEFDIRTLEQNALIHAVLDDIAAQAKHLNQVLDRDDWKRLCVAQYRADCIENDLPRLAEYWRNQKFQLVPSLDGSSLVALGQQTRDFPKYVAAGFIEWLHAYAAINGIRLSAPMYREAA